MSRLFLFLLLAVILTIVLLFFPIVVETDIHYDMNRRKLGFAVFLYKKIKLVGGYIGTYQGGIALHLSKKKAKLIPFSQLNSERKRFSIVKTFRLIAITVTTETGAEYLLPVAAAHTALRAYFFVIGGNKEKIENNLWLTDGDILRISFSSVLYFNIYILLVDFIQFLRRRFAIIWQKKNKKSII